MSESVGIRLKKVRLQKGISLEEVQRKTKIHLAIIKAIEEDNFLHLSPIYIKGFLKIYCQFLKVDPKEYIPDYSETKTVVNMAHKKAAKQKPYINMEVVLRIVFIAVILLVILGVFNLAKKSWVKHKLAAKKAKTPVATLVKKEKKAVAKPVVTEEATPKAKEEPAGIRLVIRAREDCWIQVKTDGKMAFQSVLRKGRAENWSAKEKIALILGNAGGVDLEVNSKPFTALGKKGQVLKNITITKDGLSIKR